MKKTKICQKCQSKNIGDIDESIKRVVIHHYVCFNCGYVELYISDEKTLKKIENKTGK